MGKTERVELTVLCLLRRGQEILLQNRVKQDWQGYTLPGGHIEPGESVVDAVIREMREETGLDIRNPKLCGVKQFPIDGGRYLVFLFRAEEYSGTLHSSAEGQMEWVALEDLACYSTVSDLEQLLQVMLDDSLTEFQYVIDGDLWKVILK